MDWRDLAFVAAGGAVGSMMRYGVGKLMGPTADNVIPWHTFLINLTGAFAIGLLIALAARQGWPGWWRPLVAVGVLGGYTTFSTFSLEVVELALHGQPLLAGAYAGGSTVLGVAGCFAGLMLGRAVG